MPYAGLAIPDNSHHGTMYERKTRGEKEGLEGNWLC